MKNLLDWKPNLSKFLKIKLKTIKIQEFIRKFKTLFYLRLTFCTIINIFGILKILFNVYILKRELQKNTKCLK